MEVIKKLGDIKNLEIELQKASCKKDYQPQLTNELDKYDEDFTEIHLLKIVLWKLNRFPQYKDSLFSMLNDLKNNYSDGKMAIILKQLLDIKGIDLPMASTILRFLVPNKCQIIDQRSYRILCGTELKLSTIKEKKVEKYIDYLEELNKQCLKYNIDFKNA